MREVKDIFGKSKLIKITPFKKCETKTEEGNEGILIQVMRESMERRDEMMKEIKDLCGKNKV